MDELKGPLRYPGSKAAFAPAFFEIAAKCEIDFNHIVEPYCGSAAISLYALQKGICSSATLIEKDPLIYAFWYCVFNESDSLVELIKKTDITLDTWFELESLRAIDSPDKEEIVRLGFAGLFFNRANYSGIIGAKPIGGMSQTSDYKIDCRFNKQDLIKRIERLAQFGSGVEVVHGDAVGWLHLNNKIQDTLIYVDPPYFDQGRKLYRHYYELSDHYDLYEALSEIEVPWILSYDKHHIIELLYKNFNFISLEFRYSSRMPKLVDELLISNVGFDAFSEGGVLRGLGKTLSKETA
ncbi:DNA adenine methylase [Pseudomonas aeruginosa]|uniref:DNA adenine methylase n=1 Tax=Pseudomonas aeruginosa TaxID=287 RepID=UPI0018C58B84|nr:DNA adenine methylase [Pseudomonas aeruginosa]ELP1283487.1 DNA adenine methylase [Pseudomonas aeruginosa]MBG4124894.1 DNA adenine methylase [Pseudomonas aeruginosa]MCU9190270.1 DNA adenine methylase [Pseudomonas aeruginosa]MDI2335005.1 DNA adenine methylase [Pseudomonas aeruginosa]MDI2371583.1 DNA adenine methylase [Pseudomonas aeruginosa]